MARIFKGRKQAYDNVAVGSAVTTQERVISGSTAPSFTANVGNSEKIAVAVSYGEERVVSGSALMEGERLGN